MRKLILSYILLLLCSTTQAQQTVGLYQNTPESFNGYTLFSSIFGTSTYLIDNCGKRVHEWAGSFAYSRTSVHLLPDGSLLRSGSIPNSPFGVSAGGAFEKLDWNGTVTWHYNLADTSQCAHHDFKVMPNGNLLAAVWETKTTAELIANGRNPANIGSSFWPDKIVELQPIGTDSAIVVWEWRAWDHLIQDFLPTASNYGVVADHPELIDINLVPSASSSWMHVNSLDYNPALDQILFSVRNFNEIMVIDHSTTTAEAAGHTGGNSGKGGDILYRWGNPANYDRGTSANRILYQQHDAQWIDSGLSFAGKISIFNNGIGKTPKPYSTVEVIAPPLLPDGSYSITGTQSYGPATQLWVYPPAPDTNFYSATMGGATFLSNGNVLICEAASGELQEVDSSGQQVWKYVSPLVPSGILSQGATGNNGVFKVERYAPDYSGFASHTLVPGNPIELNPLPYTCSIFVVDAVEHLDKLNTLTIAPNPVTSIATIAINSTHASEWSIRLMDLSGRCLTTTTHTTSAGKNNLYVDMSYLPRGCYIIQAATKNARIQKMILLQ